MALASWHIENQRVCFTLNTLVIGDYDLIKP